MNPEQQKSILAIALFAAFADGAKHDREREEIRRIAESLGGEPEGGAARRASPGAAGGFIPPEPGAPDLARLYQDVLLKRISLEAATATLQDPASASWRMKWRSACATPTAARARPSSAFWMS
jgi:hypothetical protein